MYASIVVLTYQSPDIDFYTYEVPKELEKKIKAGQLVAVPFGKRNPIGLILNITPTVIPAKAGIIKGETDPRIREDDKSGGEDEKSIQVDKKEIRIKLVSSILLEKPILLPYQIELLKWMSTYYIAPMINCLKAMLPDVPKALSDYQQSTISPSIPLMASNQQSIQTLILVPSINHLPQVLAQFPQAKNYTVYTNELKPPEKFITWQKISFDQYDFIFGSRSAIFAPCPNLKKIIIFDEHENAYKDDRSPYFDTLTVAEKICALTKAKIEIVDSSPRVTTFANHKEDITLPVIASKAKQSREQIATGSSSPRNDKTNLPQTKIISLANNRKLGNFSPISIPLEEIIKRAYAKNLSILFFLNKKIESGSIYCKNCKHQEFFKSQPEICPNCKSPEIFFNSTNINSLGKEVKKILPNSTTNILAEGIKQSTIDSGPASQVAEGEPRFQRAKRGEQSTIDIATSSVFYKLLSKKYELVAHIYADSPLNFNEYNSTEEIYSQISNLKKLTKKLLVIQTYNEDLPAIKFSASNNYPAFYKSELMPRKILNYPPYALLIKMSVTGKKEIEIEKKSQKLFQDLSNRLQTTSNPQPISIIGPFKSRIEKTLTYNIIIKIKIPDYSLSTRGEAIVKMAKMLQKQRGFKIVLEPKSLS